LNGDTKLEYCKFPLTAEPLTVSTPAFEHASLFGALTITISLVATSLFVNPSATATAFIVVEVVTAKGVEY